MCFIIEPVGDDQSKVRNDANMLFEFIVRPPLQNAGYTVTRPLDLKQPGIITTEIFKRIIESDLAVANLTGHNPNVFYEVAIRHVARKPIIHVITKGEPIPFDIHQMRAIVVDMADFESMKCARDDIRQQIDTLADANEEMRSPVSLYLDLQLLRQSAAGENQVIADLVRAMATRIEAMANLEFDEKLAVMASYKRRALSGELYDFVEMIRNDLRAATHLKDLVERSMRETLVRDYILIIVESALNDIRLMDNSDKRQAIKEIIQIALQYNLEVDRLMQFDSSC